jgi:hypothetical protein
MMCKRCGHRSAVGYFEQGQWFPDYETIEPDSYCQQCAEHVMAEADDRAYSLAY